MNLNVSVLRTDKTMESGFGSIAEKTSDSYKNCSTNDSPKGARLDVLRTFGILLPTINLKGECIQ